MSPPEPAAKTRWDIVWLAIGAGLIAAFQFGKVPPALPALRDALELTMVSGGWLASLLNLVAACLAIAFGFAADRIGPRRAIAAALFAMGLGGALGAIAEGAGVLFLARLIESLGFVSLVVAAPAQIVRATLPAERNLAVGLWSTYMPAGFSFMLLVAPVLLGAVGWRGLWLANAALALGYGALFWALTTPARWPAGALAAPAREAAAILRVLRLPGPWLLGLSFALYSLQWFAIMAWLPTMLIERQGHGAEFAALLTALVVMANILGNLGGTWLLRRGVASWRLIAFSALASLAAGIVIFASPLPDGVKILAAILYSMLAGMTPAAALTGAVRHAPSAGDVAASNGIVMQAAQCGSLLGPPILALLVGDAGAWSRASGLFLVASGFALLLALALRRLENVRASA